VTTDLLRRYGRSPRGVRLRDHTPCGHWETHTIVAALRPDGLTAPAVFDGPIDTASFRAYVEQVRDSGADGVPRGAMPAATSTPASAPSSPSRPCSGIKASRPYGSSMKRMAA